MVGENSYTFQWHITHRCNLRCKHCYLDEYAKETSEIYLITVLGRIVEFLKENNGTGVLALTGGEPLVSPYLFNILDYAEKEPRIEATMIASNGTLINQETIDKLKKYTKFRAIQVSIDGTPETHDSIRGKGAFNKSINAIKLLHENKIKCSVSFTANRLNYREFVDVGKIVSEAGADLLWTDRVVPLGDEEKKEDIINNLLMSDEEFSEYIKTISEAKKKYSIVSAEREMQFIEIQSGIVHMCLAGIRTFTITADCELMPCRRLEENFGSLIDNSISELLTKNKTVIREIHKIPKECFKCKHLKYCRGGAKCMTHAVYGVYNIPDPNCKYCNRTDKT